MRRIGLKFAVLGLCGLSVIGCSGGKERQAEYFQRAQTFFEEGNFQKARIEASNVLQIDASHAEARFLMALLFEQESNWQQMFANLSRVVELDPQHVRARIKLGQMFYANAGYEQAMEQVDAVLKLKPGDADAHMLRGSVYYRQGDNNAAIREAHLAMDSEPGHVGAISILSEVYKKQDPERALSIIGDGIRQQTRNATLALLKIDVLESQQRIDDAAAVYRELIEQYPENLLFHYRLVTLLEKHGRIDEAEQQLRSIVNSTPDNVTLKLWLAQFISNQRDINLAEETLQAFIQRQPELVELRFALAKVHLAQKEFVQARAVYVNIVEQRGIDSDALLARNRLVELDLLLNNRADAEARLAEILSLESENSEALVNRARLALQRKDTKTAISDLRTVVKNNTAPVEAMTLLAQAHTLEGDSELALDNYRRVLGFSPTNLTALLGAARIEIRHKQFSAAENLLNTASRSAPQHPDVIRTLVEVFSKQERWVEGHDQSDKLMASPATRALGLYLKGRLYLAEERVAEGISALKLALVQEPRVIDALRFLAKAYVQQGQIDSAVAYLKQHVNLHSEHAHAHEILADLYALRGEAQAEVSYLRAIEIQSDRISAYKGLGAFYVKQGKPEQALQTYLIGLAVVPDSNNLDLLAALQYQQLARFDEAVQHYQRVLARDPADRVATNNLAMLYVEELDSPENRQAALALVRTLVGAKEPAYLDTLGWVHFKVGSHAAAISYLQSAVDADDAGPEIRLHLAKAYLGEGKAELAKLELNQVVESGRDLSVAADARALLKTL